jgi:pantothenate synthetase
VRLDYFELVDPDTLDPVEDISGGALAAVAAFVGSTRLIDNILLGKNGGEPQRQKDFAKA